MQQLLSEELRPKSFNELSLDPKIKSKFISMHQRKEIINMIFFGKPGSGKTTVTKLFSMSANFHCEIFNGSLDTSVDIIREKIEPFASTPTLWRLPKICIIDEAEFLSKNAQASLRGLIEDTSSLCRFIFTTNDLGKIDPALKSRLLPICFDMTPNQYDIELKKYKDRILNLFNEKYPHIPEKRILNIIDLSFPDYRSIANKLEFEVS